VPTDDEFVSRLNAWLRGWLWYFAFLIAASIAIGWFVGGFQKGSQFVLWPLSAIAALLLSYYIVDGWFEWRRRRRTTDVFTEIAVEELRWLIRESGLTLVEKDEQHVRYDSEVISVEMWADPRGEIDLTCRRHENESGFGVVEYVGIIGRADRRRVVQLLSGRLRAECQSVGW
jgi:hypothetical protein